MKNLRIATASLVMLVMGAGIALAQDAFKLCDDGMDHAANYVVYAREPASRNREMKLSMYYGLMSIDIAAAGHYRKIIKAPDYPALQSHWTQLKRATDTPTRGNIAYKIVADWLAIKTWLTKN